MNCKLRVLLLNPPFKKLILRDYYCSTYPKAGYYWQPIDLMSLWALLEKYAEIKALDAIVLGWSYKKTLEHIEAFNPVIIFALVAKLSQKEDLHFLKQLKKKHRRIVMGGEVALDQDFDFNKHDYIDTLLTDFTSTAVLEYCLDGTTRKRLTGSFDQTFSIGIMPHAKFEHPAYRLPLWKGRFYSLLTDFGCPFACRFCNTNHLGYKTRDLQEIIAELQILDYKGAQQIYLRDMTFGAKQAHTTKVLDLLAGYHFHLRGYLRADQVGSPGFVDRLVKAGFKFAQIGIESPCEIERKNLGKPISNACIKAAFKMLQSKGIKVGAHFMVGFRDDPVDIFHQCTRMAQELSAAYCSINLYQVRLGAETLLSPTKNLSQRAYLAMLCYNGPRYLKFLLQ